MASASAPDRRKLLTIICPVHNEESTVPLFHARMRPVMEQLSDRYETQLLFINNASTDGTLTALRALRAQHDDVYYLSLSSNVGYERSLDCGTRSARGDLFVMIDVDCEDPPEMIPDFVRMHEEGFDIVYGERVDREEWLWLKLLRKLFYRFTKTFADEKFILDMAEFLLMTAEVRDAVIQDHSSFPFVRASIGRIGFRIRGLPYKRQPRIAGRTHYNLLTMAMFAVGGILSSSTLLLRLPLLLLLPWLAGLVALGLGMMASEARWVFPAFLVWTTSYIGATCAVSAVYIARVYKNSLGRPNYVIDRRESCPQG